MAPLSVFERARLMAKRIAVVFCMPLLLVPSIAFAQISAGQKNATDVAAAAGISGGGDLIAIIGRIINIFLGFLGIIFLVLLLYAGFLYMTAGGKPEPIEKAKSIIKNSIIGLVIITSAWGIVAFVLNALVGATTEGGLLGTGGGAGGSGGLRGASGSLGQGIIESHLPQRNATGVPRNTGILITFKEAIDPASFIAGWTEATSGTVSGLNADAVKIFRTKDGEGVSLASEKVRVTVTPDRKTFVLKPVEYLGSPTAKVGYTVTLKGGKTGILKKDGTSAFGGSFSSGYNWSFEVSTVVDLTPPKVVAAMPREGGKYARNIVLQVMFSKAIDPTTVSGKTAAIEIRAAEAGKTEGTIVAGEFRVTNAYQTAEFIPTTKCGTNSCGKDVFCLPADKSIQVLVKAASIDSKAGPPTAVLTTSGYDGIVDMVGNSLDGNGNDKAEGPPTDNYSSSFGTSDALKIAPPQIESTVPGIGSPKNSNVPLDQPPWAYFDSILQSSTVNSENAKIIPLGPGEKDPDTFWFSTRLILLNEAGADVSHVTGTGAIAVKSAVSIEHRPYLPSGKDIKTLNYYHPSISSGVQDEYQNCFNPARTCAGSGDGTNCCDNVRSSKECVYKLP